MTHNASSTQRFLSATELRTLASIYDTFAPPESDRDAALRWVEAKIALLSPKLRTRLRKLLRALSGRLLTSTLVGRPLPFSELDFATRERALLRMADSNLRILREAFQGLKRLCLFFAYAAVNDAGKNPLWQDIQYPGPRNDLPEESKPLRVYPSSESAQLEADVVVVGSGAGGSVAAAVFAGAGKRVIVLEAGGYVDARQCTQREAEMMSRLYLEAATLTSKDSAIALLAGCCVGGGTVVNSCASLRLPEAIASQWSDVSGGIDFFASMDSHVSAVEERLQLRTAELHNANNGVLERGCRKLGWHIAELPRNAGNCSDGGGYCNLGCAYGCKRSATATFLDDAVNRGAIVVPNATVQRIIVHRGRAKGVEALVTAADRSEQSRLRVPSPMVVLAAGTLRTPCILARSLLGGPQLGKNLHLHPTTALVGVFDEPIEVWHGPMQTAYSDRFAELDDHYGARLEAIPAHPGQAGMALPWRGRAQHAELLKQMRYMAGLIALTRDRGGGAISLRAPYDVNYRLSPYDARHMLTAIDGLVDAAFAAGAQRVFTLHSQMLELRRVSGNNNARDAFARDAFRDALFAAGTRSNQLGMFSAHQMGTCRMHRNARHGVVDEFGSVHGVEGVLVTDASVFPLASGVNPMITIMALAHRSATHHARA